MPSLKDLKNRIGSVKSTQKITSAMKMVAAAKLRKAQEQAIASRPYCINMEKIVSNLSQKLTANAPLLLTGKAEIKKQLLVVFSADRGLCGGFNTSITRSVKNEILQATKNNIETKLLLIGRKSADALRREFGDIFLELPKHEFWSEKDWLSKWPFSNQNDHCIKNDADQIFEFKIIFMVSLCDSVQNPSSVSFLVYAFR